MEKSRTLLADEQIAPEVIALVRDAQKWVVLVTPYLDFWGHLENAISLAVKKGVTVRAIVRLEDKVLRGDEVAWLIQKGVTVLAVEGLHAKIYMSERAAIVGSMNLTEHSTKNSHEIALLFNDAVVTQEIRQYIKERVVPLAQPVASGLRSTPTRSREAVIAVSPRGAVGFCIRCGGRVPFDRYKPLCPDDYDTWAEYGNEFYPEDFCHSCGRPADTTSATPLCYDCYQRLR